MFTETIDYNTMEIMTETKLNTQAEPLFKGKAGSMATYSLKLSSPTAARCGICKKFLKILWGFGIYLLSSLFQQEGTFNS